MKAKITWVPSISGGRISAPLGPSYSTVAKFTEDEFSNPLQASEHLADVHFLAPDAPNERLISGRQFELFEGAKLVAFVELLS
jgi:hypothetical protein